MTTGPVTGAVWGESNDRARAYLIAEASRPFSELVPIVEAARARLLAKLEGVSEAQAAFRPSDGEGEDAWGVLEIARHLVRVEMWITERVEALSRGERPPRFLPPDHD